MWNSRRDPVFVRTWQVAVHVLLAPSVTPRGRLPFWVLTCLFLLTETLWAPPLTPSVQNSRWCGLYVSQLPGKLIRHLHLETYLGSGTSCRIFLGWGDDFLLCFLQVFQELSGGGLEFLERYCKHVIFLFFVFSLLFRNLSFNFISQM